MHTVKVKTQYSDLGCADSSETQIQVFGHPLLNFTTEPICENETLIGKVEWQSDAGLQELTFGSGSNTWGSFPSTSESSGVYDLNHSLIAGNHSLSLTATSTKGCASEIQSTLQILEVPKAAMSLTFDQSEGLQVTYSMQDKSIGHTGVFWKMGDGTEYELGKNQNFKYTFQDTGQYWVQLIAHSGFRCFDSSSQWLRVLPFIRFMLPNAISANDDGLNDFLNFNTEFVTALKLELYNRWGEKVLVINELEQLPATQKLPMGVYYLTGYIQDFRLVRHPIHQSLSVLR